MAFRPIIPTIFTRFSGLRYRILIPGMIFAYLKSKGKDRGRQELFSGSSFFIQQLIDSSPDSVLLARTQQKEVVQLKGVPISYWRRSS
jgi:hypothetical protein